MSTTKNKHHHHHNYDIYGDIEKIKNAFSETAVDVRGAASDMVTDSIDDLKKKSSTVKKNVADYTADKPFQTIGLTFLAGLLFGYFLHK